jgi:S-methylmethionine-dependent homocysteine/selenocysteine methylase
VPNYRQALPQLNGELFLTDGGIETTLIFHDGLDLPHFAAFDLLKRGEGRDALRRYFRTHASIAKAYGVGFILESATWRASADWADLLGYSKDELAEANRESIALLEEVRRELEGGATKMVISGCVGPRGDGYDPGSLMTPEEAEAYHDEQIATFSRTDADMITAITMTNAEEAIGVTRAARSVGMPVAIAFTVETDGRLPTGQSLKDAIEAVDAATASAPAYYMINCAHPTHFETTLATDEAWVKRIRGLRSNASTMSHAELDEAEELDDGDPEELGRQHGVLKGRLAHINVFGGCCGTDHRHVEEICKACAA